ncbi:type II toxin-antitoxin system VapC family toxin [Aeromicrobium fastidiosum]|uniref:Ribonuclease VapC n=1 Tax=Aeromicrobium fastidiosum TaxID=52699 RepID=A0A641AUG0_9ACTN|nr:type II toxin-antitoxin system VapC family toxin [Aeromicrobium fastidiosum]KAA1380488.1 type II toxin-antitoxin system VapC family toxin [Aeromicrobium fastidiosum]MBP2390077.1 putative nucleic acid-binding protein [Aeromicrobium fastidiosum]
MTVYFDTSAIVPLTVSERSTQTCRALWESAEDMVTSQLAYVEAAAALAQAHRIGRIGTAAHRTGLKVLDDLWSDMTVVPVDDDLVGHAATLADTQALRGYDAVHCASALAIADRDMVAATGDRRLVDAWQHLGLSTVDVSR